MPSVNGGPWSARAVVHPSPLYRIEGDPGRRGDGIYDRMCSVGAHETLVENFRHDRQLWNATDDEVEQFLLLAAHRIQDLKKDRRFKYISVSKDFGGLAGQEFEHPSSQLIATTYVPRRVLYELRAGRQYFTRKGALRSVRHPAQEERQAMRLVESRGDYVTFCPFASRVPFETWVLSRSHEAHFERFAMARPGVLKDLSALLRRTLTRIRSVAEAFHMVLHTSPNTQLNPRRMGYWKTIDEDYHWHIEILPILSSKENPTSLRKFIFRR